MKIVFKIVLILGFSFLLFTCKLTECTPQDYVEYSLDIMENNYLYKDSINWKAEKEIAIHNAKSINNIDQANEILYTIIDKAKDKHSFILSKKNSDKIYTNNTKLDTVVSYLIKDKIGYIQIPSFAGNDILSRKFAIKIQNSIKKLDENNLEYWIIDLSKNEGGNMWPMFLGLAPILKENTTGYFLTNKKYLKWLYKKGAVYSGNKAMLKIKSSYTIKSDKPKIAILLSNKTASSGEMTAIMFKGMENTTFFGEETGGFLTSNQTFLLCNGSKLALTTATVTDRNKTTYTKNLSPDVYTLSSLKDAIKYYLNNNE